MFINVVTNTRNYGINLIHSSIKVTGLGLILSAYGTINILSVVLYGCETWSLTLREERKLRVFENMVLGRIFGPRRAR